MKIGTLCWRAVSKQAQSKLFKNTGKKHLARIENKSKALSKSGKQDEKHYARMVQKIKSIDQEWYRRLKALSKSGKED